MTNNGWYAIKQNKTQPNLIFPKPRLYQMLGYFCWVVENRILIRYLEF